MSQLVWALISAFILTITIEYAVLLLFFRSKPVSLLIYSLLINGITNPLLNYLYLFHYPTLWVLEIGVITTEGVLIHLLCTLRWRMACIVSTCINCASLSGWVILSFFQ